MTSAVADHLSLPSELESTRVLALATGLSYAGGVSPAVAWHLFETGVVHLVDVRTTEERKFVGHVPGTSHVAWATGTSLTRNPRFARELEAKVGGKDAVVLLLCRSGKRSVLAAEVASVCRDRTPTQVRLKALVDPRLMRRRFAN